MEVKHLDFLRSIGAGEIAHSGRSLLEHLIGTEHILATWGCDPDTCLAGLFHSVYGTNAFRRETLTLDERPTVARLIGAPAERLVHLFHISKRPAMFLDSVHTLLIADRTNGDLLEVDEEELSKLLEIECANLIEQGSGVKFFRSLTRELEGSFCVLRASILRDIDRYKGVELLEP